MTPLRCLGIIRRRRGALTLLVLLVCAGYSEDVLASQVVKFGVAFSRDRLGITTIAKVATTTGQVPSPLTGVDMRFPKGLSLGLGALGLASCAQTTLERDGPVGCSPNAVMGFGSAIVEVPFGSNIFREQVNLLLFMGPPSNGHTGLLIYADGKTPSVAHLVFPAALLGASGPFGASLKTVIPLTPSVSGAPDVAIVSMSTTFGPEHFGIL